MSLLIPYFTETSVQSGQVKDFKKFFQYIPSSPAQVQPTFLIISGSSNVVYSCTVQWHGCCTVVYSDMVVLHRTVQWRVGVRCTGNHPLSNILTHLVKTCWYLVSVKVELFDCLTRNISRSLLVSVLFNLYVRRKLGWKWKWAQVFNRKILGKVFPV